MASYKLRRRKPSDKMIAALRLIAERWPLTPGQFAVRLWDTRDWKPHAVGRTGGAYLDRLRQMGLVDARGGYLTWLGRRVMMNPDLPMSVHQEAAAMVLLGAKVPCAQCPYYDRSDSTCMMVSVNRVSDPTIRPRWCPLHAKDSDRE